MKLSDYNIGYIFGAISVNTIVILANCIGGFLGFFVGLLASCVVAVFGLYLMDRGRTENDCAN